MKNILSYPVGTTFSGSEIKKWITYHLTHETSHTKMAKQMEEYLSVKAEETYVFYKGGYESSASFNKPMFKKR